MAAGPAVAITAAGSAETVFRWRTDACAPNDIPDSPARAFRDATGTVHLFAAHFLNLAMVGPTLDSVHTDCAIVFRGDENGNPEAFDDRIWLAAFHTDDGRTVAALAHAEFQGNHWPALCPSRQYKSCWWNAVLGLTSRDGGRHFERSPGGRAVVAALPYDYVPDAGRPTGYFAPSNILARDGFDYAFIYAEAWRDQQRGACLLRTRTPADPSSWRAWDGKAFAASLARADRGKGPAARHVCKPLRGLDPMTSMVTDQATGAVVGLFTGRRRDEATGADVVGVWYVTSRDLLHWSPPRLLRAMPLMFAYACGTKAVYAYPSLLDPASASRNFDSVSNRPYLYLTRFNIAGCKLPMDRDLIRVPLHIAAR